MKGTENKKDRNSGGGGRERKTMNEKKPGELGAGFLTAPHLFPGVHFNGFQVHSGLSLRH